MTTAPYQAGDRRPIASRESPLWQATAARLARAGVPANGISVGGMVCGIGAGACLVATPFVEPIGARLLFAGAAAGMQLRLLANMLDGMVAIAARKASPVGELYNELPDRISDTAIFVGAGYALGGHPALGWAVACGALLVTYLRAVGKTLGVPGLFLGPMSKSHRMFTMTVACLYLAAAPQPAQPLWTVAGTRLGIMAAVLVLILAGELVTGVRRLARIVAGLRGREGRP